MTIVTGRRVVGEVVHPAMDAIAHGIEQDRLIVNTTPEIDSLVEVANALVASRPREAALILDLAAKLAASNGAERDCSRTVAGNGERIAADLDMTAALSVRGLSRALRPLLDAHAAAAPSSRDRLLTERDVRRLVPDGALDGALAHELGRARTAQLRDLLGRCS